MRLLFHASNVNTNAKNRYSFKKQKQINHAEENKYYCNKCDFQAGQTGVLKEHQRYKHEGIIFTCDQCEFRTTVQFNLVFHKEVKHDGIRYLCRLSD